MGKSLKNDIASKVSATALPGDKVPKDCTRFENTETDIDTTRVETLLGSTKKQSLCTEEEKKIFPDKGKETNLMNETYNQDIRIRLSDENLYNLIIKNKKNAIRDIELENSKFDKNLDNVLKYIRCLNEEELYKLTNYLNENVDFIKHRCSKYSINNPHLTVHWYKMCKNNNISPKKILLFNYLNIKDKNYLILMSIVEGLMKYGYSIKRYDEFIICKNTGNLIIKKNIYDHLKKYNFPLIYKWSNKEVKINVIKYCNMYNIKEYEQLYLDYKKYFKSEGMSDKLLNKILGS